MKLKSIRAVAMVIVIVMCAGLVYAESPHFKSKPALRATDEGLTLQVCGAIAGLGNGDIVITVTAQGDPETTCTSPGGNQAPGRNPGRIEVSGAVNIPQSEIKNGSLSFCVRTEEPEDPSGKEGGCPNNNWDAAIVEIDFSDVHITVEQGGVVVLERDL
jgi:hypothetical protein